MSAISISANEGSGPISVPAAIIIGLITSFVQSLGLTIQRKSHIQNAHLSQQQQRSEWKRPMWVFGFVIFIVANIGGTVFQIGALPIVMLAPLGAVSLLYNALLARFILDDFFSKYMIIGTALIAIGAVLIGYFGVVQEPTHSLDDLLSLFARPTFVAFASLFFLTFIGVLGVAHLAEWQLHIRLFRPHDIENNSRKSANSPKNKKKKPMPRRWSAPSLAPVAEVSESSSGIATPVLAIADEAARRGIPVERVLMQRNSSSKSVLANASTPLHATSPRPDYGSTRARGSSISSSASSFSSLEDTGKRSTSAAALAAAEHDPAIRKVCLGLAIAYGGASGTLSGACLLLAKTGVELLVLTIGGVNQFDRWQSWFLVIVMLSAALLQLWYLNKSLRLASPPLVCPLAFCFYNTSSIALGMVYFDQLGALSPVSIILVILGTAILLSGVWMVSLHGSETEDEKDDEEERPEDESAEAGPSSSNNAPQEGSDNEIQTPEAHKGRRSSLFKLRTDGGESGRFKSSLLSPPSAKRRGLYEALLERGLSIGISPSSPGFHVGSTFEMDPEDDEDGNEARRLWKNRLLSRRTFSENDTSLASARKKGGLSSNLREGDGIEEEEGDRNTIHSVAEEEGVDDRQSLSSAWTRIVPTLDIQALNDRLRKIKTDAGEWIGKKRS
ncbi:uncharacterized protein FA14DRAFT_146474 [Meira miltonrushii]|uniref:DUF803-domain-containing protein n=1 Tax=Meira miltonrushii TaxID=1280837 RepID=A0A316VFX0_9BASI|nr:uncharacterized protein FA14DRAFT_146474 [Meira miltonrushii]PWN36214.1 hypothetical protein FA14DRAFT_146474 [Meira miltonrushii]